MQEYTPELPKHVAAQLQEHTSGGYILFRISKDGDVVTNLEFDNEVAYFALVKKATSTLKALNEIDDLKDLEVLSFTLGGGNDEDNDDDEESDDDENENE